MEALNEKLKKCEICQEIATSICFKCNSYFCDSCSKFVHDKPINREHKKENIDPFVPIEIKCKIHNVPLNLFCLEEKGNKYYLNNKLYIFIFI